jgi:hypothetical protein
MNPRDEVSPVDEVDDDEPDICGDFARRINADYAAMYAEIERLRSENLALLQELDAAPDFERQRDEVLAQLTAERRRVELAPDLLASFVDAYSTDFFPEVPESEKAIDSAAADVLRRMIPRLAERLRAALIHEIKEV